MSMKRFRILAVSVLAACLSLVLSCSESDCGYSTQAMANFLFKSSIDSSGVAIDTLTVLADGTDSVLINMDVRSSAIQVPVNKGSEMTAYTFLMTVNVRDTIPYYYTDEDGITQIRDSIVVVTYRLADRVEMYYKNKQHFISPDCGITYTHSVDSLDYTTNLIRRIDVVNPVINESDGENFHIYF